MQQHEHALLVCHGDVHPGNVIQSADGPVLLDWDLLCAGPAAWDHAPLMTWTERWGGEAGIYERSPQGYGRSFTRRSVGRGDRRTSSGRGNVDASARRSKPIPAAAEEAELRLRYWRGE